MGPKTLVPSLLCACGLRIWWTYHSLWDGGHGSQLHSHPGRWNQSQIGLLVNQSHDVTQTSGIPTSVK
uniref:Putative uncharacterized 7 kDa protein n=1 Tax=Measles virus (strain Halle) TaxID=11236 RepID=Y7K_MEASH|nr:RecName: Full=Putative uncharacterized 7 kDa protein [Measles virus strain Halle]CAA28428.1 unnamed protein product [Measles morbillivirus]